MDNTIPKRFSDENDYWAAAAGSPIVQVLVEEDTSQDYEQEARHLYKLKNGRFAVVDERGCSCYTLSDVDITTYDTKNSAQAAYDALRS